MVDVSTLLPLYDSPHWEPIADAQGLSSRWQAYNLVLYGDTDPGVDTMDYRENVVGDNPRALKKRLKLSGAESGDPDQVLDGKVADIGDVNFEVGVNLRSTWFWRLKESNRVLNWARNVGLTSEEWGTSTYRPRTELDSWSKTDFLSYNRGSRPDLKYNDNHTPDLFVIHEDSGIAFVPYSIVVKIVSLHNKLYGTSLKATTPDRSVLRTDNTIYRWILDNVRAGLAALEYLIEFAYPPGPTDEEALEEIEDLTEEAELEEGVTDFILEALTPTEREQIIEKKDYKTYFSTTFNKEVITSLPLVQNFFLTAKHFQNIGDAFATTNQLTSEILISTIRNADGWKAEPSTAGPPSTVPANNTGAIPDDRNLSGAAKDFILKMLIMTPINILKGIVELIDPHVAIAKLIKTGTGFAFNQLETPLGVAAAGINTARKEMLITEEEKEAFVGLSGNDLLKLILCVLDLAMKQLPNPATGEPPPENFHPRITEMGVDFTGTISGMLMIPPSPLGIIYLLLGLIKIPPDEMGTTQDVIDVTAEDDCDDNEPGSEEDED